MMVSWRSFICRLEDRSAPLGFCILPTGAPDSCRPFATAFNLLRASERGGCATTGLQGTGELKKTFHLLA